MYINAVSRAVKLGLMAPQSGIVEMYGAEIIRAAQIACAQVNEAGGVLGRPLELCIEDDGSLPHTAVPAALRLVDGQRCAAIIGNLLSNSRIAVATEVAATRAVPYLNFSFYEGNIDVPTFFHFAALPNQQIDRMIPFMAERFGGKMYFIGSDYEWPKGSINAARMVLFAHGGRAVGEEYFPIGVDGQHFEGLLDRVKRSGADVLVPYFAGADQVELLTRFSRRGLKGKMAVVMGHYDEVMASRLPPEVRAGFYSSNTYFMSIDTAENRRYLERLAKMPGVTGIWPYGNGMLTNFGEGAYHCVHAFARAAIAAGSLDSDALVAALEHVTTEGPQGVVRMDPITHHAHVSTFLARSRVDGTFAIIERFGVNPPVIPAPYRRGSSMPPPQV
jgi:ABC-type branched-subunit amino acid transport system substrate-binding protein